MGTTTSPARYPEICVRGTPREMGRQLGEAARDQVRGFAEIALARVNITVNISRQRALEIAAQSTAFASRYAPHMVDELQGVAESSGVSLNELMLLQVRNQLRAESDAGCTSLSIRTATSSANNVFLGQNWDNDPALDPFTIVLSRHPEGMPAFMNVTQAGLIAYIGFNEAGMGVCLNTLPAAARDVGVPHYFTVREIYESSTLAAAVQAVRRAERAIPANIMLATPDGPADLEVTLEQVHVLRPSSPLETPPSPPTTTAEVVTHTNHCRHRELADINGQFPELIQSRARQRRIDALIASSGNFDTRTLQRALVDHDGFPRSICRHANGDQDVGHWQTVFSVIIEPGERRMHISRGNPCTNRYETYVLDA